MGSKVGEYPLAAAMKVRIAARDRAATELAQRQRELTHEEEKLRRLEMRQEVLEQERASASNQLFETDDGVIDVAEIDRRRGAIQFLEQRLEECGLDIASQEADASAAKRRVDRAREEVAVASREVEVLEKHRSDWQKQLHKKRRAQEEKALQEISTHRYSRRRIKSRKALSEGREVEP